MSVAPGEILKGRYRIVRLLGAGGFGAVYRAWDINLQKPCAVKENLDASETAARQFEREARLLSSLNHSNLPRVTDYFVLQQTGNASSAYLVMDFVEGEDLKTMLERQGGALALEQVLNWADQVCTALVFLHSQKPPIIHRDVKPANVRITPEGQAVLVDFGIAKQYDPTRKTTTGAMAITPGYSPPEQYGMGSTDARSDLYALGATLYHLLSGNPPPSALDVVSDVSEPPRPLDEVNPQIPVEISQAIMKALNLRRSERWANVSEFQAVLHTFLAASNPPQPAATTQITAHDPGAGQPAGVDLTWRVSPALENAQAPEAVPLSLSAQEVPISSAVAPGPVRSGPMKTPGTSRARWITWYLSDGKWRIAALALGGLVVAILWVWAAVQKPANPAVFGETPVVIVSPILQTQPATSAATVTVTAQKVPSLTPAVEPDISATLTSDPRVQVYAWGTPLTLPETMDVITPTNAAQLNEMARWEAQAGLTGAAWSAAGAGESILAAAMAKQTMLYYSSGITPLQIECGFGADHLVFSPDALLLPCPSGAAFRMYSTQKGDYSNLPGITYYSGVSPVDWIFAPGNYLVAVVKNNLRQWKLSDAVHYNVQRDWSLQLAAVSVAISPNGAYLAHGESEGEVWLWDLITKDGLLTIYQKSTLKEHSVTVSFVRFSPDGKLLASASLDKIAIWRLPEGVLDFAFKDLPVSIHSLEFSPSGAILAAAAGSEIRLWNMADGNLLKVLDEHINKVTGLAWSPDGRYLVSTSDDGGMRFWGIWP